MANDLKPSAVQSSPAPAAEQAVELGLSDLSAPAAFSLSRATAVQAASLGQEVNPGLGKEMVSIQLRAIRESAADRVNNQLRDRGDPMLFSAAADIGSVAFKKLSLAA